MTGPTGVKFKETLQIENIAPDKLHIKVALVVNGGPETKGFLLGTVTGSHVEAMPLCGGTVALTEDFDATPTELKTYVTVNNAPLLVTFKKK
jgi:hypothetical protein